MPNQTALLTGQNGVDQFTNANKVNVESVTLDKCESALIEKQLQCALAGNRFLVERDANELKVIAGDIIEANLTCDAVERLRRAGCGERAGVVVVNGLPAVESPPPTPIRGYCDDAKVAIADATTLGIFHIMGISPVAFEYENDGRLVRNVVPNPDSKGVESSHGFDADLGWHHDNPCGPFEPDQRITVRSDRSPIPRYLGFVCMRNRDRDGTGVPTELLPVANTIARLDDYALAVLAEPEFTINPPASNDCQPLARVPLLVATRKGFFLRFNASPTQVFGVTERAKKVIEELKLAMASSETDVIKVDMQPGSVLVFDNYRVSHRRRSFDPGDDWTQARWLRRIFGCSCLLSGKFVDRLHWPFLWR